VSALRYPVTFAPSGVTLWVEAGATLLSAAREAGIVVPAPCGGRGVCGKCAVRVSEGNPSEPDETERRALKLAPRATRLACRLAVTGPLTVRPIVTAAAPVSAEGEAPEEAQLLAALDLGTTTVSAVVIGAESGRELGRSVVPNSQATWGADVISRIAAARDGEGVVLRRCAEQSIIDALTAACDRASGCLSSVRRLVVVGNSAMASLLLGMDVRGLAGHPFSAPFQSAVSLSEDSSVARTLAADAETIVLPPIAGFVGGDLTAGLVAGGLIDVAETTMYVDAGTNAEMALVSPNGIWLASAAAGPAFEGFGVSSGGPATTGAVTCVRITGDGVELDVVGGGEPLWFAGSGLLSAMAELRRVGQLDESGRLVREGPLRERFAEREGVLQVDFGGSGPTPLSLTQTDVRALQTAKAAVAAGMVSLVKASGVKPRTLSRWILAGAFGGAMDVGQLFALGIMPKDALSGDVRQLADAALLGAAAIAVEPRILEDVTRQMRRAEHVSLADDPVFSREFVSSTALSTFTLKRGFSL